MSEITVVGLDLAKRVFPGARSGQAGAAGVAQASSARTRFWIFSPICLPCLIGMEALCWIALLGRESCGRHWATRRG